MTTEQEKNRRAAEQLRLIDDDFLRLYFNDNPDGIKYVLDVILQRQDLKVIRSETQSEYRSLSGRSIALDIYAEDQLGKKYNIEVQRADAGASPKRARFHSSMLDTKLLKKNEKFDLLPETYVIFITENDVMGHGLPLYHFDRRCEETGDYIGDEAHILFVNGSYQNPNNSIGRLMHDFMCVHADDMYSPELAERFRYFKETEGGMIEMCKIVEERAKEYARIQTIETIKRMLAMNKFSYEDIAASNDVSVEFVEDIANGKVA